MCPLQETLQMAPPQRRQGYLFCRNLRVTHVSYFFEKVGRDMCQATFLEGGRGWHVSPVGNPLQVAPPQRRQAPLFLDRTTYDTWHLLVILEWHMAPDRILTHGRWMGWHVAASEGSPTLTRVKRMAEERRWHVAPTLGEPYADTWQVNGRREKRQVAPVQGTRLLFFWVFQNSNFQKESLCDTTSVWVPHCFFTEIRIKHQLLFGIFIKSGLMGKTGIFGKSWPL